MNTISENVITFLLNAAWQITLIAALAATANRGLRSGPAKYRHLVWAVALLAAVTVPMCSLSKPAVTASLPDHLPAMIRDVAAPSRSTTVAPAISKPTHAESGAVRFSAPVGLIVTVFYCLVVLYRLSVFASAWRRTMSIRASTEGDIPPPPLERVWSFCTGTFGLRDVRLLKSSTLPSPVVLGIVDPAVIVPRHIWDEPSEELLTAAIGHELAHVSRHDFVMNLFYELLFVVVAFHPAAWYVRSQLERTREMACDEWVTQTLLKPQTYARSILRIATSVARVSSPGYTLGIFEGGNLEDRIRRVLRPSSIHPRRARLFFAAALSSLVMIAVLASAAALTARGQTSGQALIQQGIDAYNAGDFRTATRRFSSAVSADPANIGAKLYLANSLMSEFYAEREHPDVRLRDSAMEQYREVLAHHPENRQALAGMSALTMEAKQFGEAQQWTKKLTEVTPNDKSAWYTVGVLDWMMVYGEYQRARQAAGGAPESYAIPNANLRKAFRNQYLPQVEEGIGMLRKALALDPNYDAAMAYINLLYRIKAAMADSPAEASGFIAEADRWVGQALETKRRNPAPADGRATKLDPTGPPPGPALNAGIRPAPPPPPPPPPPDRVRQIASAVAKPVAGPNERPQAGEYWQVVAATDMPAIDLYRRLSDKGFQSVMHYGSDRLVRVLAGPYFDQASADKAKADLTTAGFRVLRKWE